MKKLVPALCLMFCIYNLQAQDKKSSPGFGKVDKSEFSVKECEFDKNAEAVALFDNAEAYCFYFPNSSSSPLTTQFERHVRIRILTEKGLDEANIQLSYFHYRNLTRMNNLVAQTYNMDASGNIIVTKLDKKNIYEKKLNKRFSQVAFTMPEVKVGSIIEYKYRIDASELRALYDWNFQQNIPVMTSTYTVDFPKELEIHLQRFCSLPVKYDQKEKTQHIIQSYTMENIPGLRDEPYISCEQDYLQRIEPRVVAYNSPERRYNLEPNWINVIKELMTDEDFGIQLKRSLPKTDDLDKEVSQIKDDYKKMQAIYSFVRKSMEWNGYTSIWALEGVKSAWKDRKGTTGEINLILVNLLKEYGLNASPILVSTHENGAVKTHLADINQFNKVMAYVSLDGKEYFLDATNKFGYPGLIPEDIMYSEGLVIEKIDSGEWGWKTIWDPKKTNRDVILLNLNLNEEGKITGSATVNSYDYSKTGKLKHLETSRQSFLDNFYPSSSTGMSIDSISFENTDKDSLPLIQKIQFQHTANASGDYKYFSPNIFTGLEKNPFIADKRFSDVFFSTLRKTMLVGNVKLPESYQFDELPKNIRMITPDTGMVFTRVVQVNENIASFRINVEFMKPFYSVQEYDDFKEFYKQLFDLLNEQFVIRKKATPKP